MPWWTLRASLAELQPVARINGTPEEVRYALSEEAAAAAQAQVNKVGAGLQDLAEHLCLLIRLGRSASGQHPAAWHHVSRQGMPDHFNIALSDNCQMALMAH
jgi:hypothetical protein